MFNSYFTKTNWFKFIFLDCSSIKIVNNVVRPSPTICNKLVACLQSVSTKYITTQASIKEYKHIRQVSIKHASELRKTLHKNFKIFLKKVTALLFFILKFVQGKS
jgi:hypothetical protein